MGFLFFKDMYLRDLLAVLFFIYIHLYFLSLKMFSTEDFNISIHKVKILLPIQGHTMPNIFKKFFFGLI